MKSPDRETRHCIAMIRDGIAKRNIEKIRAWTDDLARHLGVDGE